MAKVTHDQADLLLRLYEIRREPKMREAREWFISKFHPTSLEDSQKIAPFGSPQNAYVRMVASYWDMAANMVNRGLINEEFFFETSGEQWLVWERLKNYVPEQRARSKNPHMFGNLEKHVKKLEAWRKRRAPGSTETMRQMMAAMTQPPPKA
jgi:hypothetical protein